MVAFEPWAVEVNETASERISALAQTMSESPLCDVWATVWRWDKNNNRWYLAGTGPQEWTRIEIYQNPIDNTFRVMGRKKPDQQVVINCPIVKELKLTEIRPNFYQWWDKQQSWGLEFGRTEQGTMFAKTMAHALGILNAFADPGF